MAATVLDMSMSLDGFIAGPNDVRGNGLGDDGHILHDWLAEGTDPASHRPSGVSGEVFDEVMEDAAGDRNVLIHGARTAQLALAAGVLDELEIHQVPVLLGQGRRLFDDLGLDHIELELARIIDAPGVAHLRYRVRR